MNDYEKTENKPVVAHSMDCWLPLTMTWVSNQVKYMDAFSSIVLADRIDNFDQFPWYPVYFVQGAIGKLSLRFIRKLMGRAYSSIHADALNKYLPILLHSHFADRGWNDIPLVKRFGLKHVVTFYGYDVNMLPQHPVWKKRYRELFAEADLFLCEGPHMAKCVVNLGCPEEKVSVQRLGVALDNIPFEPRKIDATKNVRILIAGTFREKKGIPYSLEAVGLLRKQYPNVSVTLIGDVTGQEREEKEKQKIIEVIRKYDLQSCTKMMGFQPHKVLLKEAYNHHIFLSPSITSSDGDTEGGAPVTIIEMAASGLPIVSTSHCDIPYVLGKLNNNYLVNERDCVALKDVLLELISDNNNLCAELGYDNRKHIEANYNIEYCSKSLSNIYYSII
jgi:colanic acid/amylovoran biosynthesis glycosyltransferase